MAHARTRIAPNPVTAPSGDNFSFSPDDVRLAASWATEALPGVLRSKVIVDEGGDEVGDEEGAAVGLDIADVGKIDKLELVAVWIVIED